MNQIFGEIDEMPKALRNRTNQDDNQRKVPQKKKKNIFKKIFITLCILFVIGVCSLGFLIYGPYNGFRDWLITTAMTTMTHQWIAYIFYSEDTVNAVMANNTVEEIIEDTDTDAIVVALPEEPKKVEYANE